MRGTDFIIKEVTVNVAKALQAMLQVRGGRQCRLKAPRPEAGRNDLKRQLLNSVGQRFSLDTFTKYFVDKK